MSKCSLCGRFGHTRGAHYNARGTRYNLDGYVKDGVFHPIRNSPGYSKQEANELTKAQKRQISAFAKKSRAARKGHMKKRKR